jgi:hypothetical protein
MPPKPLPARVIPQPPPLATIVRTTPAATPAPSAPASVAPTPATSPVARKKKKKKGKGKGPALYDGEGEDDDDLPELEPVTMNGRSHAQHTGLSPELESVHLSTTASLSAATGLTPTAVAEAELLATADHLARSMEVVPDGMVNDEYWASFPDHLRNFVRHTYSQLSSPGNEHQKTQAMYAIAQQIHSGAGVNFTASTTVKGTTRTTTTRYPPGAFPTSMSFDPSIFTDPAITQAMERAAAANGLQLPMDHHHGVHLPSDGGIMHDYTSEEQEYGDEDFYSEDELDQELEAGDAQFTVSYEEHVHVHDHDMQDSSQEDFSGGQRKKNRKKKKKSKSSSHNFETNGGYVHAPATPPATAVPVPAPPAPAPRAVSPVPTTNLATPVSASHNRMPAPPRPPPTPNPPPSSRAAGKQPMAYSNPAPQNPPPQSRRAASKAPITSHAYQHNHAHHHPSPPSSNASAPHKPRPPANGANGAAPGKNGNKIWSTSTTEERERIKEFWLGLGEEERRNLVRIEKEAVLRKMKEQQKHSCMCAVCGRKRSVPLVPSLYCFVADLICTNLFHRYMCMSTPQPFTQKTHQTIGMK